MSSYRYRQTGRRPTSSRTRPGGDGLDQDARALRPLAPQVLVLGDTPTPAQQRALVPVGPPRNVTRVQQHPRRRCAHGPPGRRAGGRHRPRRCFVPTADWLCASDACPVVVGDVLVYRDDNHITATAASWLAPFVEAAMMPLVGTS